MLCLRRLIRSIEDVISTGSVNYSHRNYTRTLHPVSIRNANNRIRKRVQAEADKDLEHGDVDVRKIKREFQQEIKAEFRLKGDIGETEFKLFEEGFESAQKDFDRADLAMERNRMYKKHFQQFTEKEVNVLTYAEKEKIRYLHSSNSEEWTPEVLASSFPVTPEGVEKLLKSKFRARSTKEIQAHDVVVADRIGRIKSGEVPLTPELEQKMKMRDKMPLNIGAFDPTDKNLLMQLEPFKPVGQFQSLVTLPKKKSTPIPIASSESVTLANNDTGRSNQILSEPDLGDSYVMRSDEGTISELKDLNLYHKRMTFQEFKSKIKSAEGKSSSAEIQYIKNLPSKVEIKPTFPAEVGIDENSDHVASNEENRGVSKFRNANNAVNNASKVRGVGDKVHLKRYQQDDGDRIYISPERKRDGATYQRGNSFYDENGDLLYRVV